MTTDPNRTEMFGTCPLPQYQYDRILLGHGSGGGLTADLIAKVFVPGFGGDVLAALEDQATVRIDGGHNGARGRASPSPPIRSSSAPFFPGGDIGTLAVYGTINDLAVGGAKPLFLSAAFILEEGLPLGDLKRIVASMRQACQMRPYRCWRLARCDLRCLLPNCLYRSQRMSARFHLAKTYNCYRYTE